MARISRKLAVLIMVFFGAGITPTAAQGLVEYALILVIAKADVSRATLASQIVQREFNNNIISCKPQESVFEFFEPGSGELINKIQLGDQIYSSIALIDEIDVSQFDGQYLIAKVTHRISPNEINRINRKSCQPTVALLIEIENVLVTSYSFNPGTSFSPANTDQLIFAPSQNTSPTFISTIVGRPSCRLAANGWNAKITVRDRMNGIVKQFFPTRADDPELERTDIGGGITVFTAIIDAGKEVSTVALPRTCADYVVNSGELTITKYVDFSSSR